MTPEEWLKHVRADGLVAGEPVKIRRHDGQDQASPIPPLHRPAIEVLLETVRLLGPGMSEGGDEVYRATLASPEVRVGGVTVGMKNLSGVGETKDAAVAKLSALVGQGVAQAYVKLRESDDKDEVEAARSMEIGDGGRQKEGVS